jgi:hypothetical protein
VPVDELFLHTERITDANGNAQPTFHQWILLDLNGDGVLDKGIFSESTDGTSGSQQGGDIPSDQIQSLQSYFEQAVHNLNKKATEGPSDTCIPS